MAEIINVVQLAETYQAQLRNKYSKYAFKKKAKKEWLKLYSNHLNNIAYSFELNELKLAYNTALRDLAGFCEVHSKLRVR